MSKDAPIDRRSALFGALGTIGGTGALAGIGYLLKRWIEGTGRKDKLALEVEEIERVRKLAELRKVLDETGQTPQSLKDLWGEIEGAFGAGELTMGAKPFSCFVSAVPSIVRIEGITEPVGRIAVVFTSLSKARGRETLDVEVALNTPLSSPWEGDRLTRSVLLLEGDGTSAAGTASLVRAEAVGPTGVRFQKVRVELPAAGETKTLHVRGLRTGITYLPAASVLAFVSIRRVSDGGRGPVVTNDIVPVGMPLPALQFRVRSAADCGGAPFRFNHTEDKNPGLAVDPTRQNAITNFTLQFRELRPGAFRTMAEEASMIAGSSGVTNGTRLMVRFSSVPSSVEIFVTTVNVQPDRPHNGSEFQPPKAVLVSQCDANGGGGTPLSGRALSGSGGATGGVPISQLRVANGYAFAAWEWVSPDPPSGVAVREVSFGVALAVRVGAAPSGTLQVKGTLAPLSSATLSSAAGTDRIPRFVDTGEVIDAFRFS